MYIFKIIILDRFFYLFRLVTYIKSTCIKFIKKYNYQLFKLNSIYKFINIWETNDFTIKIYTFLKQMYKKFEHLSNKIFIIMKR